MEHWINVGLFSAAIIVGCGFIWFCGYNAKIRIKVIQFPKDKDKAELEDNFRKTAAQIVGGGAVVLVAAYTLTKDNQTFELTRVQSALTAYSEGAKLLMEKDPTVRAAAIYLLERVVSIRPEYSDPVARTLVAFILRASPQQKPPKAIHVDVDVRAAVQVLGRTALIPSNERNSLNLDAANLAAADFGGLSGFRYRRFEGADLRNANFAGADLTGARLSGTEMNDSGAYGPSFSAMIPQSPDWSYQKYWYTVQFDCADLTHTQFDGAGLVGALFGYANVDSANFERANISRADFSQARNLESADFMNACADEPPIWPKGFECQLPTRKCSEPLNDKPLLCSYKNGADRPGEGAVKAHCSSIVPEVSRR